MMKIKILENEKWYGGQTWRGFQQPFDSSSDTFMDCEGVGGNQLNPIMLSSEGRYFYCPKGFSVKFEKGEMTVESKHGDVLFHEGLSDLRTAFNDAKDRYFPAGGVLPPEEFFSKPQINSWIERMYDQNQEDILKYAHGIVDNGFEPGILMVDDLWNCDYGRWDFDPFKFPDPKAMLDELHSLGFKLLLWICPYVSPDSREYRALFKKGGFVRDPKTDRPRMVLWWNGYSAMLDLTNPVDREWITEKCRYLMEKYGVDGFKFDAGDTSSYLDDDITHEPILPIDQTRLWAEFGTEFPYNELRACFKCTNIPTVTRQGDKSHSWDSGLNAILYNALLQSTLGYCFCCPDMVGGGLFGDFIEGGKEFDSELFVRFCGVSVLMPMLQFSLAPWRVLSDEELRCIKSMVAQREEYLPEIMELVRESAKTGEPALNRLEYYFPHEGLAEVKDQFMLGDSIMVAPCIEKGKTERSVKLPKGTWKAEDGTVYEGGTTVTVPAPYDRVPVLRKI